MSTFLHQNVAFAPKYTEVRYIGFVTGKEFVGGLLEKAMQIEPVYGMASCIYGFRPKTLKRLVFPKHCSRHVDERHVLPFYYTILLWCVESGELMLDAFLLKIFLHLKIFKFSSIVASDFLHFELKLILSSSKEALESFLGLRFI